MAVIPKASHIQGKFCTIQLYSRPLICLEYDEFEVGPRQDWRSKGKNEGKKDSPETGQGLS